MIGIRQRSQRVKTCPPGYGWWQGRLNLNPGGGIRQARLLAVSDGETPRSNKVGNLL